MSVVFFDSGISLDGYMAGDNRSPHNPIGDGGTSIHNWLYKQRSFAETFGLAGGEEGAENDLIKQSLSRTGAYIMGKRMFEEGEPNWPEDLYKADVFVLTNEKRNPWIQKGSTVFYFINDGIHSALEKAKESAGNKDIRLQGGADMIQQYLNAGYVDEFLLHFSPVILGSGIRLFENIDKSKYDIEISETIPSIYTTHIRYNLKRR